jgi:hypothetical protein
MTAGTAKQRVAYDHRTPRSANADTPSNMHLVFATAFWAGCATIRTAPTLKALHNPMAAAAASTSVARMVFSKSQAQRRQRLFWMLLFRA